jgi:acyl-CoA dehydrogenase
MPDTILYDSAMRLFGDLVTQEVSADAERGAWPDRLWQAVEAAGYPDVLAEGAAGMVEAATILRAAGHHAAPIPLAETMLARWLCAAGEAPAGALTIGPVEPEDRLEITEAAVSGHAGYIPWGTATITGLQPSAARCTVPEDSLASPHRCAAVLFRRARVCAEPCIR